MTRHAQTLAGPEAAAVPQAAVLQRACACGAAGGVSGQCPACAQGERLGLQPKLTINPPGDRWEQEADRIADQVVSDRPLAAQGPLPVTPLIQRQEATQEEGEEVLQAKPAVLQRQAGEGEDQEEEPIRAKASGFQPQAIGKTDAGTGAARLAVSGGGRPLLASERAYFEPRIGHDLSSVRIHDDARAGAAAQGINARAYTLRNHIAFAPGAYDGRSQESRKLLAHELVHTLQQSRRDRIQRKPAEQPKDVSLHDLFPFKEGGRVQIVRELKDLWFLMIQGVEPLAAEAFNRLEGKTWKVEELGDDVVEAVMEGDFELPTGPDGTSSTLTGLRLRLERSSGNEFTLSARAVLNAGGPVTDLFTPQKVKVSQTEDGFALSLDGPAVATIKPNGNRGAMFILERDGVVDALPDEIKEEIPKGFVRAFPESLELISLSRLPEAEKGSSKEQTAMQENVSRARARTRPKRQKVMFGAGLMAAKQFNPMLEASWQINFTPIKVTGGFVQFPLRVALQYAPTASVLGKVSSGVDLSFAQLEVPVNVQLIAGAAAGGLRERNIKGKTTDPLRPAAGPMAGVGLGIELKTFRMDVRYEHLFNLVSNSPNAHLIGIHFGGAF